MSEDGPVDALVESDTGSWVLYSDYDALAAKVATLEGALRGLYKDNVDYLRLNQLGGYDNHWLKAAREALGIPAETRVDDCSCEGIDSDTGLHTANCVSNQKPECICPKCGLRHGGSSLDGGF
jgi:hypothetical protein